MQRKIEKDQTALIPMIWIDTGMQKIREITINTEMQQKVGY